MPLVEKHRVSGNHCPVISAITHSPDSCAHEYFPCMEWPDAWFTQILFFCFPESHCHTLLQNLCSSKSEVQDQPLAYSENEASMDYMRSYLKNKY